MSAPKDRSAQRRREAKKTRRAKRKSKSSLRPASYWGASLIDAARIDALMKDLLATPQTEPADDSDPEAHNGHLWCCCAECVAKPYSAAQLIDLGMAFDVANPPVNDPSTVVYIVEDESDYRALKEVGVCAASLGSGSFECGEDRDLEDFIKQFTKPDQDICIAINQRDLQNGAVVAWNLAQKFGATTIVSPDGFASFAEFISHLKEEDKKELGRELTEGELREIGEVVLEESSWFEIEN